VIFPSGLMRWLPYGAPEWVRDRIEDEDYPDPFYRAHRGVIELVSSDDKESVE